MKVKIIKKHPTEIWWYNDCVGKVFEIINYVNYFYLIKEPSGVCATIPKKYCEILEENKVEKILMTEEWANEIYDMAIDSGREYFIEQMKQAGYITRPVWEEAEEMYNEAWDIRSITEVEVKQHEAIIALKEKAGIK